MIDETKLNIGVGRDQFGNSRLNGLRVCEMICKR